eukprot:scaffold11434_cov127-Isochrysis_galbana.AAC.8
MVGHTDSHHRPQACRHAAQSSVIVHTSLLVRGNSGTASEPRQYVQRSSRSRLRADGFAIT